MVHDVVAIIEDAIVVVEPQSNQSPTRHGPGLYIVGNQKTTQTIQGTGIVASIRVSLMGLMTCHSCSPTLSLRRRSIQSTRIHPGC